MRSHKTRVLVASLVALLLVGCRRGELEAPPELASVEGSVELVGILSTSDAYPSGERRLTTVDSILVVMRRGDDVVQATRTVGGRFRFDGLEFGEYQLVAGGAPLPIARLSLAVQVAHVVLETPIEVRTTGDGIAYPNPFRCRDGIMYRIPWLNGNYDLTLTVYRSNGALLGSLGQSTGVGNGSVAWGWGCWGGGVFTFGPGAYWITVEGVINPVPGEVHWSSLVFVDHVQ